jgi:hypothetical protein
MAAKRMSARARGSAAPPQKVQISERALLQRLNRKLAEADEVLKKTRPVYDVAGGDTERLRPIFDHNLGEFYTVNTRRNVVSATHVDLRTLAKEYGVLKAWEDVAL